MRSIFPVAKSVIYILFIAATYYLRGYQANEYLGYRQIDLNWLYFFVLLLTLAFGVYLFNIKYKKPSDYFLLLYGMIVVVPYGVLCGVYSEGGGRIFVNMVIILLPFLSVAVFCGLDLKISIMPIFSQEKLMKFIFIYCLLVIVTLFENPPSAASFSLLDSYERRLEARDVYGTGTISAYMSAITMNGVLPLVVFVGVLRRNVGYIVAGLVFYFCFYYIYGVKAPVMYMLFSGVFAYFLRRSNGLVVFYNAIYCIFMLLFVFAWLEFLFFDYSIVEDYVIRRIYYVGAYLVGVYFDALSGSDFSLFFGLLKEKSASMYIGEDFLGLPDANANTNTFLYYLLQHGYVGYLFSILFVCVVFLILNSLRLRNDVFAFLALMYAVLVLEQSATTALFSSGIGFVFVIFYFSRVNAN